MSGSKQSTDGEYQVILLTKAGIGPAKRTVLSKLAATDGINVLAVIKEDLIHGSITQYVGSLLRNFAIRRGRGYPFRAFNFARDVSRTLCSRFAIKCDEGKNGDGKPMPDVPVKEVPDMLSKRTENLIRNLDPDLAIVWGTRILPQRVFNIPTDGSIGVHAGKIPEYRGGPAGFWELYNDESEAGVTVQQLSEELDAGEILRQEMVPIKPHDMPGDIRARQHEITADLVFEAVHGLSDGSIEPKEWDETKGNVNTPPTLLQLAKFWLRRKTG